MNTCDACGSSNTELDESYMGNIFIVCNDCQWCMLYDTYVKDYEPDNYGDD